MNLFFFLNGAVNAIGIHEIFCLNHQIQLLVMDVAFDRICPRLLLNTEQVCEYAYLYRFSHLLIKPFLQLLL